MSRLSRQPSALPRTIGPRERLREQASRVLLMLSIAAAASCVSRAPSPPSDNKRAFEEITGGSLRLDRVAPTIRAIAPRLNVTELSSESAARAASVLAGAARKYPHNAFDCVGIETVLVVSEMDDRGQGEGGFAIPDRGLIVLAADDWEPEKADYFLEREFHHEVFHLLERRADALSDLDSEWQDLDKTGVPYGAPAEGFWEIGDRLLDPTDSIPGFLSQHGTISIAEDKAEMFSFFMWNPRFVASRSETDSIVREKANTLLRRLRTWCPSFSFFDM